MDILNKIAETSKTATSYPDLAMKYISLGVLSYSVDVATDIILYRLIHGINAIRQTDKAHRVVAETFNKELTVKAIRNNQQGKTDYPTFMNDIAKAGVRFYEATLNGDSKSVTYIGIGDSYEERIPI